jgi:hypothetical protein
MSIGCKIFIIPVVQLISLGHLFLGEHNSLLFLYLHDLKASKHGKYLHLFELANWQMYGEENEN